MYFMIVFCSENDHILNMTLQMHFKITNEIKIQFSF